jgi:hypothetical protein
MKWGHKKGPSIKEMNKTKDSIMRQQLNNSDKKYGVTEKRKAAEQYGKKHKFDMYDSNGGYSEAGRKYNKAMNNVDKLDTIARKEAGQKTTDIMIKKYGKDGVKKLERSNKLRTAAGVAAIVAIPTLMAAAVIK